MNSFLAILGESIRLLRARKLFWISFCLSAFMALIYLSIGFNEKGITLVFGAFSIELGDFACPRAIQMGTTGLWQVFTLSSET